MHLTHVIFLFFGVCKLTSAAIPIPKVPVDADPDIGAADTSLAHDTPPEPVDPVPPGEETSGEGTVGPEIEPTLAMTVTEEPDGEETVTASGKTAATRTDTSETETDTMTSESISTPSFSATSTEADSATMAAATPAEQTMTGSQLAGEANFAVRDRLVSVQIGAVALTILIIALVVV